MTSETERDSELEALRDRVEQLERERHDIAARANAAVAAAQDRSYWLDRWHLDLNALMERPAAGRLRAILRGLRAPYRWFARAMRRGRG
jgi:hypothetical protein